ncbi:MAG: hypothetical protein QXF01_00005, partial [Candidatus Micrarchaeaceae archaeon]
MARIAMRVQAAIEYLTTYGWALAIIAVAAALLYMFVLAPSNSVPTECNFNSGVYCKEAILKSSSNSSYIFFIFANQQQYPIASPQVTVNMENTG